MHSWALAPKWALLAYLGHLSRHHLRTWSPWELRSPTTEKQGVQPFHRPRQEGEKAQSSPILQDQMTLKLRGFMVHVPYWDYNRIWCMAPSLWFIRFSRIGSEKQRLQAASFCGHFPNPLAALASKCAASSRSFHLPT